MTHTQTSRGRRTSATLRGASSLGIGGTGRVNRLVNAVLKDNGWARDAQNIRSDFNRAMQKVQRSLPR